MDSSFVVEMDNNHIEEGNIAFLNSDQLTPRQRDFAGSCSLQEP